MAFQGQAFSDNNVSASMAVMAAEGGTANGNLVIAFDDTIVAAGDNSFVGDSFQGDTIVGDVSANMHAANYCGGSANNHVSLDVKNEAASSAQADGNNISAFNDVIIDSGSDNVVVGDVNANMCAVDGNFYGGYYGGDHSATNNISMTMGNFVRRSSEGDNNTISGFNDFISVEGGNDTIAGDVNATMDARPSATASIRRRTSLARWRAMPPRRRLSDAHADGNIISGFNDTIIAAGAYGGGNNNIAGDVSASMNANACGGFDNHADNQINLTAENRAEDGATANGNTINAYNDVITTIGGNDTIVGDVGAEMDASAFGYGQQ